MRPLRYSINVTLDGCVDHRVGIADEELHRNAAEYVARCDALIFGRVTYNMMESAWRWTGVKPAEAWCRAPRLRAGRAGELRRHHRESRPFDFRRAHERRARP